MKQSITVMDEWLKTKENELKSQGYRRYVQGFKSEDFAWWKSFYDNNGNKTYQVGQLFYDYRKFNSQFIDCNRIGITYIAMLAGDQRVDLAVSEQNMNTEKFEEIAHEFYIAMSPFFPHLQPVDEED